MAERVAPISLQLKSLPPQDHMEEITSLYLFFYSKEKLKPITETTGR
jgi:hypothetical protein